MNERDNTSNEQILEQLLKTNVVIVEKINAMSRELVNLKEISRLITEIPKLHFPKDELEKDANLTNRFLAEIIMGIPRNRRRKGLL